MNGKKLEFEPAPSSLIKGVWTDDGWKAYNSGKLEVCPVDETILLERYDATKGTQAQVRVDAGYLTQWGPSDYISICFTGKPRYKIYRDRASAIKAVSESLSVREPGASVDLLKLDAAHTRSLGCHRYRITRDAVMGWVVEAQAVEFRL